MLYYSLCLIDSHENYENFYKSWGFWNKINIIEDEMVTEKSCCLEYLTCKCFNDQFVSICKGLFNEKTKTTTLPNAYCNCTDISLMLPNMAEDCKKIILKKCMWMLPKLNFFQESQNLISLTWFTISISMFSYLMFYVIFVQRMFGHFLKFVSFKPMLPSNIKIFHKSTNTDPTTSFTYTSTNRSYFTKTNSLFKTVEQEKIF